MPGFRVLLIEDHEHLRAALSFHLTAADHTVATAPTGGDGLALLTTFHPDLVVLDLDLPDMGGEQVLTRLRRHTSLPVIVITGRDQVTDKLRLLSSGATDYLIKPFEMAELVSRVQAHLRRFGGRALHAVGLHLNVEQRIAWFRTTELPLSPTEFKLLTVLLERAGQLVLREDLARVALPREVYSQNTLTVHVTNLRHKLWAAGGYGLLHTVRGLGYRISLQP